MGGATGGWHRESAPGGRDGCMPVDGTGGLVPSNRVGGWNVDSFPETAWNRWVALGSAWCVRYGWVAPWFASVGGTGIIARSGGGWHRGSASRGPTGWFRDNPQTSGWDSPGFSWGPPKIFRWVALGAAPAGLGALWWVAPRMPPLLTSAGGWHRNLRPSCRNSTVYVRTAAPDSGECLLVRVPAHWQLCEGTGTCSGGWTSSPPLRQNCSGGRL